MTETMTSLAKVRQAKIEQFRDYVDGEWVAGGLKRSSTSTFRESSEIISCDKS